MGKEVICTGSADMRVVVRKMKFVQRDRGAVELQLGIQMLNRFASDHCIGEFNAAVSMGLPLSAFYVYREVCRPADGQVVSAESKNFVNIGVTQLYASCNRA